MRYFIGILLALHGLIHLLGFVKAFGFADVPQLRQHVTPGRGVLWLIAALLLGAGAILVLLEDSHWWMPVVAGVALSQVMILTSWADAKFGTIANAIVVLLLLVIMRGGASGTA